MQLSPAAELNGLTQIIAPVVVWGHGFTKNSVRICRGMKVFVCLSRTEGTCCSTELILVALVVNEHVQHTDTSRAPSNDTKANINPSTQRKTL